MMLHEIRHAVGAVAGAQKLDLPIERGIVDKTGLDQSFHHVPISLARDALLGLAPVAPQVRHQNRAHVVGEPVGYGQPVQQRTQTIGQIFPRPQKLVVAPEVERNAVGGVRQKAGEQLIGRHVHDRPHVRQAAHRVLEAALPDRAHARRDKHGPL